MEDFGKRLDDTAAVVGDIARQVKEGTLTKEDGERFQTELAALKDSIERQSLSLPGSEDKENPYNIGAMARAVALKMSPKEMEKRGLGRELDISIETAKLNIDKLGNDENVRSTILTTKDGPSAGVLIPMEMSPEVVSPLRPSSVLGNLGQRTITGVQGDPYKMLKRGTGGVAYYQGEAAAATLSKMSFSTTEGRKKKMTTLMGLTEEQLEWSNPAADMMVQDEMFEVMTLRQDLAAVMGTGTNHEPLGIWNLPSATTYSLGTNGDNLTFLHHHLAYSKLVEANVKDRVLGFLSHWAALKYWIQEKNSVTSSGATSYYNLPLTLEGLRSRLGTDRNRIEYSNQLPTNLVQGTATTCTPTILGDFTSQIKLVWGGRALLQSNEAVVGSLNAFTEGLTFYRVVEWHDFLYRREEDFCLMAGAKTT